MACCFISQHTHPLHLKQWLPPAMPDSNYCIHHPPYSPDLAANDLCLFPKLEEYLRGSKSCDDENVICAENGSLEWQGKLFWCNGIYALKEHFTKCESGRKLYHYYYHYYICLMHTFQQARVKFFFTCAVVFSVKLRNVYVPSI